MTMKQNLEVWDPELQDWRRAIILDPGERLTYVHSKCANGIWYQIMQDAVGTWWRRPQLSANQG